MDNLAVHRSNIVKDHMAKLSFIPIFNIAYSPQYNPIEGIFGLVKRTYKSLNTAAVVNCEQIKTRQWIDYSFERVKHKAVQAHIERSLKFIYNDIKRL